MTQPSSIPAELWDTIPPNLRPALAAVVTGLENRIADLEARLNQTSANSSRPPSADPPHAKPAPPRTPSGKKRGGQPGHPKHERALLPPDQIIPLKPPRCRRCCHPLRGDDPNPLVHQVHEVPAVRPMFALDYGAFLERRKRRDEAVALYDSILAEAPNDVALLDARARAVARKAPPALVTSRQGAESGDDDKAPAKRPGGFGGRR